MKRPHLPSLFIVVVFACVSALASADAGGLSSRQQACHSHIGGALPDRLCTPGTLNPAVTQATIAATICTPGWSAQQRPPWQVTWPWKRESMREYGDSLAKGQSAEFEYDHLVPISLGGGPRDAANLWPEPHHVKWRGRDVGSFAKDKAEDVAHHQVCAGRMSLRHARLAFQHDWRVLLP